MPVLISRPPWAVVLVCGSVGALALLAAGFGGGKSVETSDTALLIEREQVRFAPLIKRFPPESALGLITDLKRFENDDTPLMAIHFVLAPRQVFVLYPGRPTPEWAFGAFRNAVDPVAAGAALGYEIVETFDTGVVLYRRRLP